MQNKLVDASLVHIVRESYNFFFQVLSVAHIVRIKRFTYPLAVYGHLCMRGRRGLGLLHARPFRKLRIVVLSPGSFVRLALALIVVGINVNDLTVSYLRLSRFFEASLGTRTPL